ncbi:MAG: zinc-binding dehydrogenase [Candidatus Latescibacteria bacterium]|nr:zinc-binding dehydrogenase [Candidatus Latescibacterota bacterium]
MKAIVVDEQTPDRALAWREVPDPSCGPDEVIVDIHATAVNRADLLQRSGNYPPPPGAPPYMGLEMAGVVRHVGAQVDQWRPGDRVCALLAGGGYAEQVAVPAPLLRRIPDSWDFVTAGAVPEVFYTAFVNIFIEGALQDGETLLVHGGASGVGTAAIQLARAAGNPVLITASAPAKLETCLALGAALAINYRQEDFVAAVKKHCGGVDVILDISGGAYLSRNLSLLNRQGRIVLIALLGGAEAPIDLGLVLRQRLRLIGSVLRSRSLAEKVAIADQFEQRFWPLLVDGSIAPIIDTVLPIDQAAQAQAILEGNQNIGKVVLRRFQKNKHSASSRRGFHVDKPLG